MAKKKKQRKITPKLDLHGVKHQDVELLVEKFIFDHENNLPADIITGLSEPMKKLVFGVLDEFGFEYEDGDFFNKGYIHVTR